MQIGAGFTVRHRNSKKFIMTSIRLFIIINVIFCFVLNNAFSQIEDQDIHQVKSLLSQMWSADWGSISDSESYLAHDERELKLLLNKCEDYGWESDPPSQECINYAQSYWADENKKSIFLTWMKEQLPPKGVVHLIDIITIPNQNCPRKEVFVKVEDSIMMFHVMATSCCPGPPVILIEIDGINVFHKYDKELANGVIERFATEHGLLPIVKKTK